MIRKEESIAEIKQRSDYFYHLSSFYWNRYHGQVLYELNEAEKKLYITQAIAKLEQYKRTYTVTAPDDYAEDMAICAMADALFYFANALNGTANVSSASIGSVSVSYNVPKAVDLSPKAQEKELFRCASQYLEIYRGVS